ncbi:MAG: DUF4912 domain-containing protein [Candidatus Omnitrophota bacterium]|nr:DUF4912 domain-containing protein [Candidatus Omnitrophota bacterium]
MRKKLSKADNKLKKNKISTKISVRSSKSKRSVGSKVLPKTSLLDSISSSHIVKKDNLDDTDPNDHFLKEEQSYFLPSKYNDNCIVILPRDPWWLYSYWDISQERINEVINAIPENESKDLRWVSRAYDVTEVFDSGTDKWHSFFDVDINFDAENWYINVNQINRSWCLEIGLKNSNGKFFAVARSNIITMPYFGISSRVDEQWMLPDDDFFKIVGVYELGKSSMEMKKKFEEVIERQMSSPLASWGINFGVVT